jgi:GntR family transcriptional regulator/MocR family aminotransferase
MATMPRDAAGVDLHLELGAGTGRRTSLENALRDAVRSGRLPPGSRLPATRVLAAELRVARGTVSAAYDQLVAEGYLVARHGSATTVAELPPTAVAAVSGDGVAAVGGTPPGRHRFDLRAGSPDVTRFPVAAWLRATRTALTAAPPAVFDYGDPRGTTELRAALAAYLGRARGVVTTPDRIVVTTGAAQGLNLLARTLAVRGPATFAMEDPGLDYHRDLVRRQGVRVVPVAVDELGAQVADLAARPVPPTAVVVTPAHQFPTGVALHPGRRRALVDWARRHDVLIVEDDYDGEFRYDRQPVGALQGTAPEQVIYIGSASKTLGPAVRLGWLVLPEALVEPIADAKRYADVHTEVIGQLTLAELIRGHAYDRHVRACRLRYRRRRNLLMERLAPALGEGFVMHGIAAGLHGRLDLPPGGPAEVDVVAAAARNELTLDRLGPHWHDPAGRPQGLVVGFAASGEGAYPGALDALQRTLAGFGALRAGAGDAGRRR